MRPLVSLSVVHADASDNGFAEAAVWTRAHYVVSSDRHLLDLKQIRNPLLAPAWEAFLEARLAPCHPGCRWQGN